MATTSSFCASKLSYLSLKTKKTNLFYVTLLIILFTAFYLIGLWQHSTGTVPVATTTLSHVGNTVSCTPPNHIIINNKSNNNPQRELDFSAHHQAADPPPTEARVHHLPPCDVKYSEYVPCEDTQRSLKFERERLIYRERHCPEKSELLKCRVPAPYGYRSPFKWPQSRDFAWYANVPHKWLTVEKKGQNWVRFNRDRFRFPGGGTMFPRGADVYIDEIGKLINLNDGSIRTAIDTGCGV